MNASKFQSRTKLSHVGLFLFALFGFSELASAATLAADHVIRNSVSVSYEDASGANSQTTNASVDILVNLVAAAPLITDETTDVLDPVSTNQTVTIVLDVTSQANGEDGYFVLGSSIGDTNNGGAIEGTSTVSPDAADAGTALDLGGSSFAGTEITTFVTTDETNGTAAGTAILVPADSIGGDGVLSGFAAGERIVLDPAGENLECVVNHIVEPAAAAEANATATIFVDECATASATLSPGDQIGERGQISITVSGTAADLIELTFDVVSEDDNAVLTSQSFDINIVAAEIEVYKFVRNVDTAGNNPVACSAAAFSCMTIDGNTYYRAAAGQSGVTADPGEVLEYAVLMFNKAGVVTDIVVNDTLPLFTAYVDDSAILYAAVIANGTGTDTCDNDTTTNPCALDGDGAGGAVTSFTSTGAQDTTDNSGFFFFDGTDTIAASAGHDGSDAEPTYNSANLGTNTGGQIDASLTTLTAAGENEASVIVFQAMVDPQ